MISVVQENLKEAHSCLENLMENKQVLQRIVDAGEMIASSYEKGGKAISCGNGGSMCDAMHFAEELTGRFRKDRKALGAAAISDAGHMTCSANDFGYNQAFARYVEGNGRKGDVLFAISTSGKSENIIQAAKAAKEIGMSVISLTGKHDTPVGELADIDICTVGGRYADRVQEMHIKVIHSIIELVERKLFSELY